MTTATVPQLPLDLIPEIWQWLPPSDWARDTMFQVCRGWRRILRFFVRGIKVRHWINFNLPSYITFDTTRLTTLVVRNDYILEPDDTEHLCRHLAQLEVVSVAVSHPSHYLNMVAKLPQIHTLTMFCSGARHLGDLSNYFVYKSKKMALWRERLRTLTVNYIDGFHLPVSRLVRESRITKLKINDYYLSGHTITLILHHVGHQLERLELLRYFDPHQLKSLEMACRRYNVSPKTIYLGQYICFKHSFSSQEPIWVTNRKRKISDLK